MNSFDYIVIGAGSAGAVIAWEIVRRELGTVAVFESGLRTTHSHSRIPVLYPWLFRGSALNHLASTIPQAGLAGRKIPLPSGKGLGGSSLINAMIWSPPTERNLSAWAKWTNNAWSVAEQVDALGVIQAAYRNDAGWGEVSSSFVHPSLSPLLEFRSHDGGPLFIPYPRNIRKGHRIDVWNAFQSPAHAKQLTVLRGKQATRVLMRDNVALGMEWKDNRSASVHTTYAKRGVILSAGTLRSPEILLRSGIGPRDALIDAGIELQIESPGVGKNLQDHLVFPIVYRTLHEPLRSRFSVEEIRRSLVQADGALTSNIAELGSFIRMESGGAPRFTSDRKTADAFEFEGQLHVTPTHYLEYPLRENPTSALSIGVTPLHPASRGEIRIAPSGEVEIDPNYLSHPNDLELFLRLVRAVRDLDLKEAGLSRELEILPGAKRASDEQIALALSRFATTLYHYIGSCSVGTHSDSVCDADFRVRGAERLYICDGSVLPSQPCGNTQVSVMMLAQLLANRLAKS